MFRTLLLVVMIIVLFGVAGRWDYEIAVGTAATRMSCEGPAVPARARRDVVRIKVEAACVPAPLHLTRRT